MIYKIAIADDHPLYRRGIVDSLAAFKDDFELTIEAKNGQDLLNQLKISKALPEVVILDMHMPVMSGFETLKVLKAEYPSLKVLALTVLDEDSQILEILKLGADGYSEKRISGQQLYKILSTLVNGENFFGQRANTVLVNHAKGKYDQPQLSERELQFLRLLASQEEPTYKEMADKLHLSVKTIDTYRANLFDKLGVKSKVGLVRYVYENRLL